MEKFGSLDPNRKLKKHELKNFDKYMSSEENKEIPTSEVDLEKAAEEISEDPYKDSEENSFPQVMPQGVPWEGEYSPREYEFLKALDGGKVSKEKLISWAIYEMKRTANQLEFSANYHVNNENYSRDFLARAHILAEISEHLERKQNGKT